MQVIANGCGGSEEIVALPVAGACRDFQTRSWGALNGGFEGCTGSRDDVTGFERLVREGPGVFAADRGRGWGRGGA